jgi:ribosomal protein S18 acetylase RimI-like enzyme
MNRSLVLTALSAPRVTLRSAAPGDLEDLRAWKNANKPGFFFKGEITPEMQTAWFSGYLARPDDYMFVVEEGGAKIGCLGFRVLETGEADAYNIIAAPGGAGRGLMRRAMAVLCSYAARRTKDIGCRVLKDNPAVGYYERCGFKIAGDGGDHHVFKLDWSRFSPVEYEISEK